MQMKYYLLFLQKEKEIILTILGSGKDAVCFSTKETW